MSFSFNSGQKEPAKVRRRPAESNFTGSYQFNGPVFPVVGPTSPQYWINNAFDVDPQNDDAFSSMIFSIYNTTEQASIGSTYWIDMILLTQSASLNRLDSIAINGGTPFKPVALGDMHVIYDVAGYGVTVTGIISGGFGSLNVFPVIPRTVVDTNLQIVRPPALEGRYILRDI